MNHWVNPVEFARMIESMYADGVRLFVEAGPRGNLSAFVEDILRGKPFAAIPANVPRRSGPTQINHLVAQLAAHHVPLELGHLFGEATRARPDRAITESFNGHHAALDGSVSRGTRDSAGVVKDYLAVMEQFLDMQRDVMDAFLAGRVAPAELPLDLSGFPDLGPVETRRQPYALVERVEQFEPGRSIVYRRVMDEREDLYADDHTLGGRGVSRVDPSQNGLPVLPMTFSLEAMAEAAALLAPGKVVVAIRNVRLYRWLPFDPDPTTLEVRASVASVDSSNGIGRGEGRRPRPRQLLHRGRCEQARVRGRDRPRGPLPRTPGSAAVRTDRRDAVQVDGRGPAAEYVPRAAVPDDPLARPHRPRRHRGDAGGSAAHRVVPLEPRPAVVLDPVLVDAAMHILGAWHLEQPDWTGRILLPFEVQRIEFFGPAPAVGSRLVVRGHNEQETARQVRHGLEVFDPDGRLWLRLTGAGYWRFYLPFGHVNFFGPKDQYFLSRDFPEAVPPRGADGVLRRCYVLEPPVDLKQPVLRAAGARVTMTPREIAEFTRGTAPTRS